jgi:hypothetical protein
MWPKAKQSKEPAIRRLSPLEFIGLLTLILAVVYNAYQVHLGTVQTKQARVTGELQLLTSLGTAYDRARSLGTDSPRARRLVTSKRRLSNSDPLLGPIQLELILAGRLAYILTHRYLDLSGAISPGPLVCTWRENLALEPLRQAEYTYYSHDLLNLETYVKAHPYEPECPPPHIPHIP